MSARPGAAQRSHIHPRPQRPTHWMDEAQCYGSPIDFHSDDPVTVAAAQRVCGRCEVATKCLTHAIERGEPGVWGGTTDADRAALLKPGRPHAERVLTP